MAVVAITLTVYLFDSPVVLAALVAVAALTVVKVLLYLWQQIPLV